MPTRTQTRKAQFKHVLDTIMERDSMVSGIEPAFEVYFGSKKYEDPDNFIQIPISDLDTLEYQEDEEDPNDANKTVKITKKLNRGDINLIKILQCFHLWKTNRGEKIEFDKWTSITHDEFRAFRVYEYNTVRNNPTPPAPGTSMYVPKTPEQTFRGSIKRDPSAYQVLSKDLGFDDWYRETTALAEVHDVSDVFNPAFIPATPEATALINVKKTYVYGFLTRCLQTDKGKAFVRQHGTDRDGQLVMKKLVEHHTDSTQSTLESDLQMSYLTTAKIGTPDS